MPPASEKLDYLAAVEAPAYAISESRFAVESAFAEHLRLLRESVGPRFARIVVLAPRLSDEVYAATCQSMTVIDSEVDGIFYVASHSVTASRWRYWSREVWPLWRRVRTAVRTSGLVHSGPAIDVWRPTNAMVNFAAWLAKRPVIFVVDIDFRHESRRFYRSGMWGARAYYMARVIYDPMKWVQVWLAARTFGLVMLKGASMVADFGQGRGNVKDFYDTVHGEGDIKSASEERRHVDSILDTSQPLQLAYFGRLVRYKGVDRAIEATRLARDAGADVRLTIIGDGDRLSALREQVARGGLGDVVTFRAPVPYGSALFLELEGVHASVSTPLSEDTPRSAFDSFARGLPVIAFDMEYFVDLARKSGAVSLATWPEPAAMAERFVELSRDRVLLAGMAKRALAFARVNTQAQWLQRREQWLAEMLTAHSSNRT